MKANKTNFYMGTKANFKRCDRPEREPDYNSGLKSFYWYTDDGVIRFSDHWNEEVRSCNWLLDNEIVEEDSCGFCAWEDFKVIDRSLVVYENDNNYFLVKLNFENMKDGKVYYQNKSCNFSPHCTMSINLKEE